MADISKQLEVTPADKVTLKTGSSAKVTVKNTGDQMLTYKLKTTRPLSVRPNKAYGLIKPKGTDVFKVSYMAFAEKGPLLDTDRLTILLAVLPHSTMKAEEYWKSPTATPAHRYVLKMAIEEESDDGDDEEEEGSEESQEPIESDDVKEDIGGSPSSSAEDD